jgi:hypothetical protein
MSTGKRDKQKTDPASKAYNEAEKDILKDPELSDPDPTDDLDEGELARRDNSDEEALDYLERSRQAKEDHSGEGHDSGKGHHSGKGKEK